MGKYSILSLAILAITSTAQAAVVATLQEVGDGIVVSGGGEVNLTGLTFSSPSGDTAGMTPSNPSIGFGSTSGTFGIAPVDRYTGVTPPSAFGTGSNVAPDIGSGDRFVAFPTSIDVPSGYVSNTPLSFSNTYLDSSFASLGITPGTYVWNWGSDANADSFTLNIVPEPATAAVLAMGGLVLTGCRRK